MTGQAQTSLLAWADLTAPGPAGISKVQSRRAEVVQFIRDNPGLTAMEIAAYMGHADPNAVRPRITEAEQSDPPLVYYGPYRPDNVTGRPAYTVYPL
jgi:hypothetical protein